MPGGKGAEIGGDVRLTQGEVLTIAVGGQGSQGASDLFSGVFGTVGGSGGGGGGTFVAGPNNTPLMIAAGGGGGGILSGGFSPGGGGPVDIPGAGRIGHDGEQGFGQAAGFGGVNGAGGQGSTDGGGGGYSGGSGGGSFDGGTDKVRVSGENSGSGKLVLTFLGPAGAAAAADPSTDPPATASTATSAADQASLTSSSLGQASTPSFLAAAAPAQQAPAAGTADPPQTTGSIVLQRGNVDQVAAFDPSTEVLDLRQALAESHLSLGGDYGKLGSYVAVTDSGNDATLSFNPNGLASGPGSPLAVLHGVGPAVTLGTLISGHALAIA